MPLANLLAPLNAFATPLIKAGLGSPWPFGSGFVVLEIPGRVTANRYEVPLMSWTSPGHVVVSTVRGRSQWLRNLAAAGQITVWLRAQPVPAVADVYLDGHRLGDGSGTPSPASDLLQSLSGGLGIGIAELHLAKPVLGSR